MKLVFLDADGTLFHHEGYIPNSAIKACIQAQKNGHKIILCTGRQRIEIFGPMLEIDYDAIIAGSGATIECEHKLLKKTHYPKKKVNIYQTTFLKITFQLTLKAVTASMPRNIQKIQC